jgi:hypothetical protein
VACVGQPLAAYAPGDNAAGPAGGTGDRCGSRESAQACRNGETARVITDLGENTGGEDRAETGRRTHHRCQRVLTELLRQSLLQLGNGRLHGDDDGDKPADGVS